MDSELEMVDPRILKGGAASGFKNVKPTEYKPRLLHFHGDRNQVFVKEVSRNPKVLDKTDVYILDLGLKLLQWNGSGSNKDERFKAQRYMQAIVDERNGKPKAEVLDEGSADQEEFITYLNEQKEEEDVYISQNRIKELFSKNFTSEMDGTNTYKTTGQTTFQAVIMSS
ncbi:hypothetical protein Btru_020854 [Bulinus truncatus]|nr:hypothetical protein Btru_020854 [Bulinus truncatus]